MRIAEIVPMDNHVLFVKTEEGDSGLFDVKPYLQAEAFDALREPKEFAAVNNGGYFIEWPCGADLSADTVDAHLLPVPQEIAQQLAKRRPNTARGSQCQSSAT